MINGENEFDKIIYDEEGNIIEIIEPDTDDEIIEHEEEYYASTGAQSINTVSSVTEMLIETKNEFDTAKEDLIAIFEKILKNGEITADDRYSIRELSEKTITTYSAFKDMNTVEKEKSISEQLEEIKADMVQATPDDILNVLTEGGTKCWIYKDDDNNVLIDGTSIPELTMLVNKLNLIAIGDGEESAIKLTPEFIELISSSDIKLKASNITLEGLVTANENFKILEDGSIVANNGTFTGKIFIGNNGSVIDDSALSDGIRQGASDGTLAVQKLEAVDVDIENLKADKADITDLNATNAEIENLKANKADIEYLTANYATIENLNATNAEITNLKSDYGEFKNLTAENFTAVNADIDNLTANKADVDYLTANYATINMLNTNVASINTALIDKANVSDLNATNALVEDLRASKADVADLTAVNAKITNLEADKADVAVLEANYATIKQLDATNANVTSLQTETANINKALINKANVIDLNATNAKVTDLQATKANVSDLNAAKANISSLTSDLADITTLVNGNLTSDNIQSMVITGDKFTVADGFIKNAMIDSVNANKINAGSINTNKVTIQSNDGSMVLKGNLQQFKDKNGKVRIQIGKDAAGNFTFVLYDENGTGQLINQNGIQSSNAIADGLIVDSKVADNANIAGSKLDIDSVVTEVNNGSTSIKGTKIYLDDQKQSLNVAFNNMTNTVKGNTSTLNSHTTSINTMNGKVTQLISDTTITKENGTTISLKDAYNTTVDTVNSHSTKIGSLETNLSTANNNISSVSSKQAALEQNLNGFKQTVSDTYTTKGEFNGLDVGGRNFLVGTKNAFTRALNTASSSNDFLTNDPYITYNSQTLSSLGLKVGDKITVSFDWSLSNVTKAGNFRVETVQNDTYKSLISGPHNFGSSTSGRYVGTKTLTSDDVNINKIRIRVDASNLTITIKNMKLEKGNKATSWSPAPEDIDSSIAGVDAKFNNYSTTSQMNSAINQKANEITSSVSETYATKASLTTVDNKFANYSTTTAMNSAINQKANEITSSVSETYATKTALSTVDGKFANYSTTSQMNSAINQKSDSILSTVSSTYTTKTDFNGLTIGGTNLYPNSNFKTQPSYTEQTEGSRVTWGSSIDGGNVTTKYNGKLVQLFDSQGTPSNYKDVYLTFGQTVTLQPNTTYTLSFDYYSAGAFVANSSYIYLWKTKGVTNTRQVIGLDVTNNNKNKTRLIRTFTTDSEHLIFQFRIGFHDTGACWLAVDGVKLEKGNRATEWSPTPEDIDTSIATVDGKFANYSTTSQMNSAINQKANEITSTVSETYATKTALNTVDGKFANYSTTSDMNSAIQQKANEITSTVSETYTTKADFDNLSIGGRNLVKNSNFAKGSLHWGTIHSVSDTILHNGHKSLRISMSGADNYTWSGATQTVLNDIQPNTTITMSCWYYIEDKSTFDYNFGFELKGDRDGHEHQVLMGTGVTPNEMENGVWKKLVATATTDCHWNSLYIFPWVAKNGTVCVTDIKVELGNKATDWTPAPEDINDSITEVDSKFANYSTTSQMNSAINQKANEITSTVSNTYATKTALNTVDGKFANYSTTSAMNTAINQKSDSILSTVSSTYATKTALNTVDGKFANYSTTSAMNSAINQKGDSILSTVSSNYTTKADFNGLQVGGTNLLSKSGNFKGNTGSWTSNGATLALDSSVTYGGYSTVKIVGNDGTTNNTWIQLKPNTTYTYSVLAKASSAITGNGTNPLHMWLNKTQASEHLENVISHNSSIGTKWTKAWVTFKTPNNNDVYYMKPFIYNIGNATVWLANAKVEEGNKATDWSPAPADIDASITAVDGKFANYSTTNQMNSAINQKANEITSTVSETYATKAALNTVDGKFANYSTTEQMNSAINIAKDSITSTVSQTYSTKAETNDKINNIKVGGTNFIRNGRFKGIQPNAVDNVPSWVTSGGLKVWTALGQPGYDRYGCIYYHKEACDGGGCYLYQDLVLDTIGRNIPLTLSFDAWREGTIAEVGCRIEYLNANKDAILATENLNYNDFNGHRSYTFTTSNDGNVKYLRVVFYYISVSGAGGGYLATIGNVKLEKGNKDTDWSPAPQDIDASIEAVDGKFVNYSTIQQMNSAIDQKANEITSSVSSTYSTKAETGNQIDNLQGQINNTNNNISNNYASKSELQQTTNSITAKFSGSGGYNLLRNTGFKNGLNYWGAHTHNNPQNGTIDIWTSEHTWGFPDSDVKCCVIRISNQDNIEYGISQDFTTTIGKTYTVSFYYASHRMSQANMIIRRPDGTWLTNKNFNPSEKSGGNTDVNNWGIFTHTFTATHNRHAINIVVNSAQDDGYMWIAKPMICEGELLCPYSPHPSEVYDGLTQIDKDGIKVYHNSIDSNSYTHMAPAGFYIKNKGTDIFKVDTNGLYFKGKAEITSGSMPSSLLTGTIDNARLNSTIVNGANNGTSAKSTLDSKASGWDSTKSTVDSNASKWNNTSTKVSGASAAWDNAYNRVVEWAYGSVGGSTTINGGLIQTGTITAKHLYLGDLTNYCNLIDQTASLYGFTAEPDNWGTWFRLNNNQRDTCISGNGIDGYRCYKCNGGESFRIKYQMKSNVIADNGYCKVNVGCYGKLGDGNNFWLLCDGEFGDANSTERYISTTIRIPDDARTFGVYLQLDGWNNWSGTCRIRNVQVIKMSSGELIVDGSITAGKIAANAIVADKIAAGAITADKLSANSVTADKIAAGAITANKLSADAITGKTIIGGTISGTEVTGGSFNVEGQLTANRIVCQDIDNARYPATLDGNVELYVNSSSGNDDNEPDDDVRYKTLQGAIDAIPKFLNGKTVYITMETDSTEDVYMRGFVGGAIRIYMNGKTLYGTLRSYVCAASINVYGGTKSNTEGATGVIHPNVGLSFGTRAVSVGFEASQYAALYKIKVYAPDNLPSDVSNTDKVCIASQSGTGSVYCKNIQIVNAVIGFRTNNHGSIHVNSSSGVASKYGFQAVTGGIISLANNNQAGGKTGSTNKNSGGQVWYEANGPTFATGNQTTDGGTAPVAPTTKTLTIKSSYGDTYRSTVYNSWKRDGSVRGGDYGYGDCNGCWFFGSAFSEVKGKTISKVEITITRNSGGKSSAVGLVVKSHGHSGRPSGAPTYRTTAGTLSLATGATGKLTITNSTILNEIKSGTVKGFGIQNTYDSNNYAVCSGSCTVKITYTE